MDIRKENVMTRVIMHGCNGKMGQMIAGLIREDEDITLVAGVDVYDEGKNDFPVFSAIGECDQEADVVIDFCNPAAIDGLMDYCVEKKIPCVVCTTGLTKEQIRHVEKASEEIAILRSANMSLGINMLLKLLKEATKVLAPAGFDVEIVEKHHNLKLDAPSGTALALGDAVNEVLDNEYEYVYDRSKRRQQRPQKEIGFSSVRGGTIVGEHDVIFAGTDEVVTFSHTAYSKAVFAKGAIQAAKFLNGKPAGLYDMSQVIG